MVDLSESQSKELAAAAVAARANAYAPFSKFHVGAAILDEQGRIFTGVNVENSSYGLTICAERTAACTAVTAGAKRFIAVAVATPKAASPCGACRQFLYEFGPDTTILLVDSDTSKVSQTVSLSDLLPNGFRFDG
ncbi:MAG: cytidine deaminase [Planctomycetota bacterium]